MVEFSFYFKLGVQSINSDAKGVPLVLGVTAGLVTQGSAV